VRRADKTRLCVSAAIAGTSICARTMTRHASGKIIAYGEEADAVGPLPVAALGAGEAITIGSAARA
jgi:protein ImuB